MRTVLIIPARYDSSRLPGKPLIKIAGETMIFRTWHQCTQAFPKEDIYIATDDDRIACHCREKGMNYLMTSSKCLTGTDRIVDACTQINADIYINVQGDEPIINPEDIKIMFDASRRYQGEVLNGVCRIENERHFYSSTIPKVVMRADGRLLYMSRAPIPTNKAGKFEKAWRQVCIYVFPKKALLDFGSMHCKAELEEIEDIEILRFLEMGYEVRMIPLSSSSVAVDTAEDVLEVEGLILARSGGDLSAFV